MKHYYLHSVFGALLCGLSLTAFADPEGHAKLDMKYDASVHEVPVESVKNLCTIRIAPTIDARQNRETIGASMHGALLTGEVSAWATDGLNNLREFGAKVEAADGDQAPANGILIKSSLTRAYTWQIGLKLFSMVALKVEFYNSNGLLEEKYYRAHGDKTNMWGAESEYVTTMNYGINNMLPVMAHDLVSLCAGTQVEKYTYAGPTEAKPM